MIDHVAEVKVAGVAGIEFPHIMASDLCLQYWLPVTSALLPLALQLQDLQVLHCPYCQLLFLLPKRCTDSCALLSCTSTTAWLQPTIPTDTLVLNQLTDGPTSLPHPQRQASIRHADPAAT